MIVYVAEKLSHVRAIAPFVEQRWPGQTVMAVCTLSIGLFEFSYPRGLPLSAYPLTREPTWKRRLPWMSTNIVFRFQNGQVEPADPPVEDVIRAADTLIYACDADATGAVSYHVLLSQILGEEAAVAERPACSFQSLARVHVQAALDNHRSTAEPLFQGWLRDGLAKRFLDFNWNMNALVVVAAALRQAGVAADAPPVSKFGLQLLYHRRKQGPCSHGQMLSGMAFWEGTGRYPLAHLGSPMSQAQIILDLLDAGLLYYLKPQILAISDLGRSFVDCLHPDCEDPDLPARIVAWQSAWPASRPQIERYVRTFFGKQKRFAGSNHVEAPL